MAEKLVDLSNIFDSVAESNLDAGILDARIIMPKPRNILDWAHGEQFLNLPFDLYARQAEVAVRLFADYCPLCSNHTYLDDVPVRDTMQDFYKQVVMLEEGICPKCARNRKQTFDLWWSEAGKDNYPDFAHMDYYPPTELAACWGQRSGKSAMSCSVFMTYRTQQHLQLANPFSYYKLIPGPIIMSFLAQTVDTALSQLWPFYHDMIESQAPWFREYAKKARIQEKSLGFKPETLFKVRDQSITIGSLEAKCQAVDGNTLRGATRIGVTIDEIAFMPRGSEYEASVDKAYTSIINSLSTIQTKADMLWAAGDYNVPQSLMCNISSTYHQHDKIMDLIGLSGKVPRMVGSHLATWDMNPFMPRNSPAFMAQEAADPTEFMRNFGAEPPIANNPYISNTAAVIESQCKTEPMLEMGTVYVDIGGTRHVGAAIKKCSPDKIKRYIVSLDAGHTQNSFAVTLSHIEADGNDIVFCVDGTFSAIPEVTKDNKWKVSFTSMADLVLQICNNFNVVCVRYDRWNSIGEIERLRKAGINAECYSPTFADFEAMKQLILSGHVKIPEFEKDLKNLNLDSIHELRLNPYTHLGYQIATVQSNGKKVTKPEKGDDDMWRTIVLAYAKFRLRPGEYLTSNLFQAAAQKAQGGLRAALATGSGMRRSIGTGGVASKTSRAIMRGKSR